MTAAKVMDLIARLPDYDGQAADAVSAYTQVKLEDAPGLLRILKSECPDLWIRLTRHKWPKSWSNIEDPVVPLERNMYGHSLAGFLWKDNSRKFFWNLDGKKYQIGNVCLFIENTEMKWLERSRIWLPHGRKLMKNVDLVEPTSFLDHVYLGCSQRECKPNEIIVQEYTKIFESHISAEPTEKVTRVDKLQLENALWDFASWQTKKWSNCTQFQVPAWMITNSRRAWISGRIITSVLTNCLEMLLLGTELDVLTFYGLSTSLQDQSQNGLRHATDDK